MPALTIRCIAEVSIDITPSAAKSEEYRQRLIASLENRTVSVDLCIDKDFRDMVLTAVTIK